MNYNVEIPYLVFVTVPVKADNEEEAIEAALDVVAVNAYCGNNGHDKLIGVNGDASIYCDGDPIVSGDMISVDITVELLD